MDLNHCLRPFVILDTGIGHSSSADLGSLKTLSCYPAHAPTGFERDRFLAGAKLAGSHDVGGYFDILQRQCSKEFNSANSEQNGAGLPDTYDDVPRAKSHLDVEELAFTRSSDIPISPRPRREYVFIPERTSISLRQISEKYNNLIRLLSDETVSIHRWCRNAPFTTPNTVAHRCPGYRRQEVIVGTLVTQSVLILHLHFISHHQCKKGTFSCSSDDGVSPTIECCKCLVSFHRECKTRLANDSSSQRFTCSVCRKHRSFWSGLSLLKTRR
ncbi:hypothetical protein C8J56DRAFT_982482 [Mycena floridula]|nr:hypothetical protein C8J56DRAFT_982482 [Mycena floridula]